MLVWNEITLENDSFPPMDVDVLVRKGDEMAVAYRDSYGWEPCGVTSNYDMAEASLDFVPDEWAFLDNTLEDDPQEKRIAELEAKLAKAEEKLNDYSWSEYPDRMGK